MPGEVRVVPDEVADLSDLYVAMRRARLFDRLVLKAARRGRIKGYYPSAGQEALAALAGCLGPDDMVFPAYREQPLRLAMGITIAEEIAMWAGDARAAWNPLDRACMPANTAIGSHIPHAVGWAWAQRHRGFPGIAVAVFGDGATSEGDFHAAMNLAGVWQAPVVLVCQNNQYAQSTSLHAQTASSTIGAKAAAYGVEGQVVNGMDATAVRAAFGAAAQRARDGGGATLLELQMYRFSGHSSFEVAPTYRSRAEEAQWRARDPIPRLGAELEAVGVDIATLVATAERNVADDIEAALDAVAHHWLPEPDDLAAWTGPQAHDVDMTSTREFADSTVVSALNAALVDAMEDADDVVVLGQDVVTDGGVWGVTAGLADRSGRERVIDMPLNELGLLGVGIGMALAGMRPVVEIQFGGFLLTAFDQLAFHAARYAWRTQGVLHVPLVVRMPAGAGHGGYEGHNESFEAHLAHTPGLAVSAPSNPADAYSALRRAIAADGPVVVLEPTSSYLDTQWAADADGNSITSVDAIAPFGTPRVLHRGDDCTLVTYGSATVLARVACDRLVGDGIGVELIDLRDVVPWDREAVAASLGRTGRLVVVHDSPRTAGFGAEIVAAMAESGALRAPAVRVAQPDIPFGPALRAPTTEITVEQIVEGVHRAMRS